MNRTDLLLRARGAYERARFFRALRASALVLPMALVSFGCVDRTTSTVIAIVLAALATFLVWRGGAAGRGVMPGFVGGAVSLAFPLLACPACATSEARAASFVVCAVGGFVAGSIVMAFAAREARETRDTNGRASFLVGAGSVAALTGSLGCVMVGLGGVAAMAVGLALTAPLALRHYG